MSLSSIHGRYRLAKFLRISLLLGVFGVAAPGSIEAANLASFTINIPRIGAGSVVGGTSGTATATLSAAAPQGGVTVQVLSNSSAVTTQNIQIPAGKTTASSTITTQPVAADAQVTLSARVAPSEPLETKAPFLTQSFQLVRPSFIGFSLSPLMIAAGGTASGNLQLNGAAPSGGFPVDLSSSNPAVASSPASVSIQAGKKTAPFSVSGTSAGCCLISAGGQRQPLGVRTAASPNFDLTVSNVTQTTAQGKITLAFQATAANQATVQLTSSNAALASVPATLTIGAGNSKTFPITIGSAINECAVITARMGNGTDTVILFTTLPSSEAPRVITVGQ